MATARDLADRITHLEVALAHQQRDYETLNLVVTEQANQLDRLRRSVQRLAERLEGLQAAAETATPRTLEDDKPPHY
ncbi:SlyX family protein [Candidatus Laterigemmans baculatus]|uniref:SlyX family protein n=1 Tax=Candidatus Laterigemmans baculatus TaxID=2770505 RepID=UPI0013DA007E|nr:SlyX family protein [Candidatus Laterigemmans baculatus]